MTFKRVLNERALGAELGLHLGYSNGTIASEPATNPNSDRSGKTVLTEDGPLRIELPRGRDGSSQLLQIAKYERRFIYVDVKIFVVYARGMSVREVQGFLVDQSGVDVSPKFISSLTDVVTAEGGAWQLQPPESIHPVVRKMAIYLAQGVLLDGSRDIKACGSMTPKTPSSG